MTVIVPTKQNWTGVAVTVVTVLVDVRMPTKQRDETRTGVAKPLPSNNTNNLPKRSAHRRHKGIS